MLGSAVASVKVTHHGRAGVWARALATLLALALFGGCTWLRYERILSVHLEVLESYASKLQQLALDGRQVAPERWGEFRYPFERAQDFALSTERWAAPLPSYQAFRVVLERYGDLVSSPDVLAGPDAGERVRAQVRSLAEAIAATRAAQAQDP